MTRKEKERVKLYGNAVRYINFDHLLDFLGKCRLNRMTNDSPYIFRLSTQFQWLDAKTANFGKGIHRSTETTASVNDSELSQQGVMIFARSERKRAKNRR